jgi:hypothetical protein
MGKILRHALGLVDTVVLAVRIDGGDIVAGAGPRELRGLEVPCLRQEVRVPRPPGDEEVARARHRARQVPPGVRAGQGRVPRARRPRGEAAPCV